MSPDKERGTLSRSAPFVAQSELSEDDAFFLLRLLEYLPTQEERDRIIRIAEAITRGAA